MERILDIDERVLKRTNRGVEYVESRRRRLDSFSVD
jgi:hypothetical protein